MSQTPNHFLVTRLEGIQAALMAHHRGGMAMPNATKGAERESFVRDYLEGLFPAHFRFGTGSITDISGHQSGQADIVVEYPFLPSFPMPGSDERLYLAESVVAVIEVKSDLAAQWDQIRKSAAGLHPLRRRWTGTTTVSGASVGFGGATESRVPYIAVGYQGFRSIESLQHRLATTAENERPDAALVVESGVFVGQIGQAFGRVGLYGLAIQLMHMMRQVTSADFDIGAYVGAHSAAGSV